MVLFFYTYGYDHDFSHARLPVLVVLSFYCAQTVVRGWGEYRTWYRRGALAPVALLFAVCWIPPTLFYLGDAADNRNIRVFRYERIVRHDTIFTAVQAAFMDNHVVSA